MKYLVKPVPSFAANAPSLPSAANRMYAMISVESGLTLTSRTDLKWKQVAGQLAQLSVGGDGEVWGVTEHGALFRRADDAWQQLPGAYAQVAVGSAQNVWALDHQGNVHRWNGESFDPFPGWKKNISAAADGSVWAVNAHGKIYCLSNNGAHWVPIDGLLKQVSVGRRNQVWGITDDGYVFIRRGDRWAQVPGSLRHISAASDGAVWGTDAHNRLYRWSGAWEEVPNSGLPTVEAGSASDLWALDASGNIYRNEGAGRGKICQHFWSEDLHQCWLFTPLGNGLFKIENRATGRVLDIEGASKDNGADLLDCPRSASETQLFHVEDLGDGTFRIVSAYAKKSLDVDAHSLDAGHKIHLWDSHEGYNQRWRLSEIRPNTGTPDPVVTMYEEPGFKGNHRALGVGAFDLTGEKDGSAPMLEVLDWLKGGSFRVPAGLEVIAYKVPFASEIGRYAGDVESLPEKPGAVVVQKVLQVELNGSQTHLVPGRYRLIEVGLFWTQGAALKLTIPPGMVVVLYENDTFGGRHRVYFDNYSSLIDDWWPMSLEVHEIGMTIPRDAIRFGGRIALRGHHGKWISASPNGSVNALAAQSREWEEFTIVRAGRTLHSSHLAFGDVIALRTHHGTYLAPNEGMGMHATSPTIGPKEKWVVIRAGRTASSVFASRLDAIALRSADDMFLTAEADGDARANVDKIDAWERFEITTYWPPRTATVVPTQTCGEAACDINVCAAEACAVDACVAEACALDAALLSACGAAAGAIAVCGADFAVASGCGAAVAVVSACVAAVCGADACGADFCGAAAGGVNACAAAYCGAAACGAAACGADACAAAACGADACGADACAAEAGLVNPCGAELSLVEATLAEVCLANVCLVNLELLDACAIDACVVAVIPLIPGI